MPMKPVVVLVGRPNVGKSTLFNRLCGARRALVAELPGLTRDRQYAAAAVGDRPYLVVDTGGISAWSSTAGAGAAKNTIEGLMQEQVQRALREANAIIFLVDGREGLSSIDQEIADALRRQPVTVWLAVNKTEGMDPQLVTIEFHELGLGQVVPISAKHGDGVERLMQQVLAGLPRGEDSSGAADTPVIAIAGRPNVGKSTLVNALLGEQRVLVSDQPGTTRDSIYVTLERAGRKYVLIDTAGVRRRARTTGTIEKYSVIKTLQAIDAANVVILVLDALAGITEQDAMLAGFVLERGRAIVMAVNKWDVLDRGQRQRVRSELERKMAFLRFARSHFISAKNGTGVASLFRSTDRAFASARRTLTTPKLNRVLQRAVQASAPPRARGGPVRLKYAHQGGKSPPLVVIHGTRVDTVPVSYRRYLASTIRADFHLEGTPVRIELRSGDNPFSVSGGQGRADKRRRRTRRAAAGP
jgi:GTP-binding protein